MITCDKISVMDTASTKMTNTVNSDGKKVRYEIDCYTLQAVLLVITLLLINTIIYYHYAKSRSK